MCYAEVDSWKWRSSRVKVGRGATIKERQIRFEEEVSTIFPRGLRLLEPHCWLWALKSPRSRTGGGSWPIRFSSSVILHAVEGRKIYETYGYSFMASSPKCNGLQASIDVQLLVRGLCFWQVYLHHHEESHYFPQQVYHSMNNFERSSFVTMEESFLYADGCGVILR